jgi:1,3-beta-glucanosyltransferase GAS1
LLTYIPGLVQLSGSSVSKLSDFSYLSSEMASISPTGVNMASYTPTNSPQACPALQTGTWEAKSSPLPPAANPQLCQCMVNSLKCVVKASQDQKTFGTLFSQVCGYGSSCAGIKADAYNGTYGAYASCNSTEQLSFAFNQYYLSQNSASTACDFGGAATIKSAISANSACSALIAQAGSAGTGTVTSGATVATGTKKSGAGITSVPQFNLNLFGLGVYVSVAAIFGAGMILL